MLSFLKRQEGEEKKVEYVELIYDLVFVYVIGRNSSLVGHISNGFIAADSYLTYVICTLITIQIWYLTTMFINRYGDNGMSEYVGLFVNMFLLYYMADATRVHWETHFYRYNTAWALIILNILIQYWLKYREKAKEAPWELINIRFFIKMLGAMAAVIAAGMLAYRFTGLPLTPLAMVLAVALTVINRKQMDLVAVDFPHLTERVMLYVVFTFGEMIIAISGYFEGGFSFRSFYYALCAFLIVVGLFMSYGFLYDKLLDREMNISGNAYMLIHIFIIFALSSLTTALEFMREPEIAQLPKNIYLIASFAVYYLFIFALVPYTKGYNGSFRGFRHFAAILAVFVVLLAALYKHPGIGIFVSVVMTFTVWNLEYRYWQKMLCSK